MTTQPTANNLYKLTCKRCDGEYDWFAPQRIAAIHDSAGLCERCADQEAATPDPLQPALTALLTAAKEVRQLLDNQVLVRDISRDHEPGWAFRQVPLVLTLKRFVDAIDRAETLLTPEVSHG